MTDNGRPPINLTNWENTALALYLSKGIYWQYYAETTEGFRIIQNNGTLAVSNGMLDIQTNSTTGSEISGAKHHARLIEGGGISCKQGTWNKRRRQSINMRFSSVSAINGVVGAGIDNKNFIGFVQVNDELYAETMDIDGNNSYTLILSPIITNRFYSLSWIFNPDQKAEFYIDDILKGTLKTTLPTNTLNADISFYFRIVTSENAPKIYGVPQIFFYQA